MSHSTTSDAATPDPRTATCGNCYLTTFSPRITDETNDTVGAGGTTLIELAMSLYFGKCLDTLHSTGH